MNSCLPPEARCVQCGYALRGLSEDRCPECGRAFDPRDPNSFRIPRRYRPARPWLRPWSPRELRTRAFLVIVFGAIAVVCLPPPPAVSWAGWGFFLVMMAMVLAGRLVLSQRRWAVALGALGVVLCMLPLQFLLKFEGPGGLLDLPAWLVTLVVTGETFELLLRWLDLHASTIVWSGRAYPGISRRLRRGLKVVLALFWLNLLLPPSPGALTFWINAPFLMSKADQVIAAGRGEADPQAVGMYLTTSVILRPRGTVEFLRGSEEFPRGGVIYVPPGQELAEGYASARLWPLQNWYLFRS